MMDSYETQRSHEQYERLCTEAKMFRQQAESSEVLAQQYKERLVKHHCECLVGLGCTQQDIENAIVTTKLSEE